MKTHIEHLIRRALEEAQGNGSLPDIPVGDLSIERPQNPEHGDFACSLPLKLARPMRMNPMAIAESMASLVKADRRIENVWAASPGFVNFSLSPSWLTSQAMAIVEAGERYGNLEVGIGKQVQIEFVSVNPTGPIHVGHARGAVIGSALANILEAAGYQVHREYYINDTGAQIDLFARSLYARYQQLFAIDAELPTGGYQGDYVVELAREIRSKVGEDLLGDSDTGTLDRVRELGLKMVVELIRTDMKKLRVHYDFWFSERTLYEGGQYNAAMKLLRDSGYLVDRDGATWFTSKALGDDQDKVLVRTNGAPTYFAADVAYHYEKFFERQFDRVIDVLGADHQGHVRFMKAIPAALGIETSRLDLLIYQLVTLKRGAETVRASKRTGDIVTLKDLVEEVGADACRFFFLSRSHESHMEFDLELAVEESSENPVYYIQYAHARIASILRLGKDQGIEYRKCDLSLLVHEAELALIRKMLLLPETIEMMARTLAPHHLPHYASEVATAFHWFYQHCKVLSNATEDLELTKARLMLVEAARIVLVRCLELMAMEAPEHM